jgi:hypothetical protein
VKSPAALLEFVFVINLKAKRARARNSGGAALLCRRGDRMRIPRRDFIALLGGALSGFLCVSASAHEGYYGAGHDKWHQGFYSISKEMTAKGRAGT